jgi:hypothetical protein
MTGRVAISLPNAEFGTRNPPLEDGFRNSELGTS